MYLKYYLNLFLHILWTFEVFEGISTSTAKSIGLQNDVHFLGTSCIFSPKDSVFHWKFLLANWSVLMAVEAQHLPLGHRDDNKLFRVQDKAVTKPNTQLRLPLCLSLGLMYLIAVPLQSVTTSSPSFWLAHCSDFDWNASPRKQRLLSICVKTDRK